jgi:hypothetical protein
MSTTRISDDVWQRQDPAAAQLPQRAFHRLVRTATAVLIVVISLPVALHAGVFQPQVRATYLGWGGTFVYPDGDQTTAMFGKKVSADVTGSTTIVNDGWSTVRVLGVTITGAGFRFDHATVGDTHTVGDTVHPGGVTLTPEAPVTLPPGESLAITLFFTITDCHAVPAAPQFATIHIDSWRGNQTVRVALPTVRHLRGGWRVTSPADPQGVSSVRYLADAVCGIAMEPS